MAKFQKGQSGNPGGRPAVVKNIQELARAKTTEVVEALCKALSNPGERVPAASVLLAYGYGRPVQTTNIRRITSIRDLDDDELAALISDGDGPVVESESTRH